MVRENVTEEESADENYVYDLYYMNRPDFDFRALENIIAIEAFNEELMYDEYRGGDTEICDDDDDSNDEDNWRNDYPDEDPRFFENQEFDYFYGDGKLECSRNGGCYRGGHHWDYYRGALSLNQVTATHLMIRHP